LSHHHKILIYRHFASTNALHLQLRRPSIFSINYAKRFSKFYRGKLDSDE